MERPKLGQLLPPLLLILASIACNFRLAQLRQASPTSTLAPPTDPAETLATNTNQPGPTLTPAPTSASSQDGQVSIYAVSHLPNSRLMVTLLFPAKLDGDYYSKVANLDQVCERLADYPERLYCTGPEPFDNRTNVEAEFRLFSPQDQEPLFVENFSIPPRPFSTSEPGSGGSSGGGQTSPTSNPLTPDPPPGATDTS